MEIYNLRRFFVIEDNIKLMYFLKVIISLIKNVRKYNIYLDNKVYSSIIIKLINIIYNY